VASNRGAQRDDRSTRGRKPGEDDPRDDHVPAMDPAVVAAALGVVENGLVQATHKAALDGNVADLIRLHKHFSAIKSRAGGPGGRKTRKSVPAREELERLDHAFSGAEAERPT
jgi:predicted lipid-binding transport protein (Tim44 family)